MTRILTALVATIFIAFAAPVAEAAPKTTFTIRGAGWGHGVGMSQYGAMGYAQQRLERGADPRPLLLRHGARDDRPEPARARPARRGHALGADQRRPPGRLAQARPDGDLHAQAARAVADRPVVARQAARDVHRAAAGRRRRRRDDARRPRQLPRRARVRADRVHRDRRHERRRARRLPAGRGARRVAGVVAGRGAEGAGDRRPHVRDHDRQERRRSTTTPTRARRSTRASGSRPRRPTPPSPTRAARSSPTRASRSSPTSSRPRAGAPRRSRTRRWAASRSRGCSRSRTSSTTSRRATAGRRS